MAPFTLILAAMLAQTATTPPRPAPLRSASPPPVARPMSADTDGSGTISRQEFMDAAAGRFAKLDTNRDGQLTREERRMARGHLRGGRPGPHTGPADR